MGILVPYSLLTGLPVEVRVQASRAEGLLRDPSVVA